MRLVTYGPRTLGAPLARGELVGVLVAGVRYFVATREHRGVEKSGADSSSEILSRSDLIVASCWIRVDSSC